MAVNDVNGAQKTVTTTPVGKSEVNTSEKLSEELNQAITNELTGVNVELADTLKTLSPWEKRVVMKYCHELGLSKEEAQVLLYSNAEVSEKMSRKDADAWCQDYMQRSGCTEKEAKQAFKEEFGYSLPSNFINKIVDTLVKVQSGGTFGVVGALLGEKSSIQKLFTGQGNNDAASIENQ